MKVAVAVGPARRFVVGVPRVQLIDVLAGRLVDQLADAEHHAEKGEVVLDAVGARGAGRPRRDRRDAPRTRRRAASSASSSALSVDRRRGAASRARRPLPEKLVRQWLLPAVYERLRTGRGEFLAELRPAYPALPALRRHRLRRRRRRRRQARRLRHPGPGDPRRLRRQRPPADARRQGRLPVRRLRLAARARGRRRARRGGRARAARPRGDDGGDRDPDRDHPRPPAQRHVRPPDAPHVRLPRRRGEPRRRA